VHVTDDVTLFGSAKHHKLTVLQICEMELVLTAVVPDCMPFYERAVVNGQLVHTESYARSTRRKNYGVVLSDGKHNLVQSFATAECKCYVFLWPLKFCKYVYKSLHVNCTNVAMATCDRKRMLVRLANDIVGKLLILVHMTRGESC